MINLQVPKNFQLQQEELAKKKVQECEEKLNKFLKEENMVIKPIMRRTMEGDFASFAVFPAEFLRTEKEISTVIK